MPAPEDLLRRLRELRGAPLRDTVWVDETYINDTDLSKGYGQARKRGLSRQKLCICVAIDVHKNPVAVVCGHGKPSSVFRNI